jgi:LAO/AO transport system kinase
MIALVNGETARTNGLQAMLERLKSGGVRALARAISLVEDGAAGAEKLLELCREEPEPRALRIGVTGPPGAGKSTLVDQMAGWLKTKGERVGVVAVDPTSPYTGGALLGDRIRMQEPAGDTGIYMRSMASRGEVGGLARSVKDVCDVIEASGRDRILIETVGVGQDEVEIARLADVVVLVLVPGMGDDIQSLKAGVMEIADVFAINKSDSEGADRVVAEIVTMLELSGAAVPVIPTVATTGKGVDELMMAVLAARERPREGRRLFEQRGPSLDHLGVAVRSIAEARRFYEMLGMKIGYVETVEHEQVRVAMLPLGDSRVELLEPMVEESVIGRFLAKRGEGLHHIAVKVTDVDEMFRKLKDRGVKVVSDQVRTGAGGHKYFFVHPQSTGGVLVEMVGK